jgi:hypothetical protein
MGKMNGCNDHMGGTRGDARAQGRSRIAPSSFGRNNLSKGGVNKDLGGGATSGVKQGLRAGKASSSPVPNKASRGK